MKFPQRDTWYRKLVQRSIQAFFPRKEARSLRSRLLAMIGICALLVSGLTFAVASVGATIAWPTAPAGEATGGTMITYFKNMFGDPATGMGKSCSGSGVITGFDANGTPRCSSLSDLGGGVPGVPVLTFSAMNTAIMSGSTATLNWNTTNVSSCTKGGDWLGILAGNQPNQSLTTSALTSNKMYILICSNSVGTSVIQTVNITVTAPTTPSILMLTLPSTVNAGSSVTILWNATPVTSCTTTGPSSGDTSTWAATGLSGSGSRTFIPTISGNYTMTCSNGSVSSSQSVTITVSTSCFTFNAPTGTITAYSSTCPKDVVIPSMISGFAVQHIGNSAFNGNQLTSVTIPGSVESIGNSAFTNNLLISVTISEGVKSIGNSAFYINLLTSVTIPGSVENIEAAAFNDNKLTSVTISEGVKSIGRHAFYINQLTSVTIPGSVESIETAAFNDNKLTSITIPDSVTTIGGHAFGNQNSSNGTVYGPSSGYVKDTYNLNSGNQFDKVHLPNYVVTP